MKPRVISVGHDECVVNTIGHARFVEMEKQKAIEKAQEECSESGPTILSLHQPNRPVVIEGETGLPIETILVEDRAFGPTGRLPVETVEEYRAATEPSMEREKVEFEPLPKWTEEDEAQ